MARQGPSVPWRKALEIMDRLESDNVQVRLIKDGEHRLSRESDLAVLSETLEHLIGSH